MELETYQRETYDLDDNIENKWNTKLTRPPPETFPPNKRTTESDTAVESRRNTEFTLTFSLKTSQGCGILSSWAFTEFCMKGGNKFHIKAHIQYQDLIIATIINQSS